MSGSIFPAGWALRRFALADMECLLSVSSPRLIELSKDFVDGAPSLKGLARSLWPLREAAGAGLAYAGTTDVVGCSGLRWGRYRRYVSVQIAQARFLGCSFFRILAGHPAPHVTPAGLVERINELCVDLAPIHACVEIHGGVESNPTVLSALLRCTPVGVVIDFENMYRAGLTTDLLRDLVPADRIAYFHQRNLPDVWVEHDPSREDEVRWRQLMPDGPFLWEPKTVDDPERIRELFREYRASH